ARAPPSRRRGGRGAPPGPPSRAAAGREKTLPPATPPPRRGASESLWSSSAVSVTPVPSRHASGAAFDRIDGKAARALPAARPPHHDGVRGLDVARAALGVEQGAAQPVLREPLPHRCQQRAIAGKLVRQRLVVG